MLMLRSLRRGKEAAGLKGWGSELGDPCRMMLSFSRCHSAGSFCQGIRVCWLRSAEVVWSRDARGSG